MKAPVFQQTLAFAICHLTTANKVLKQPHISVYLITHNTPDKGAGLGEERKKRRGERKKKGDRGKPFQIWGAVLYSNVLKLSNGSATLQPKKASV